MGVSLIEVVNAALVTLGEQPIMSIEDNTPTAIAAKTKAPLIVPEVLKSADWNCARITAKLAKLDTLPNYSRFKNAFQLPTSPEFLRVVAISPDGGETFVDLDAYYNENNDPEVAYDIEGDKLFCDLDVCVIKYTGSIDVAKMDATLRRVVEAAFAHELSYSITSSTSNASYLEDQYRKKLKKARFINGMEKNARQQEGDVLRARTSE